LKGQDLLVVSTSRTALSSPAIVLYLLHHANPLTSFGNIVVMTFTAARGKEYPILSISSSLTPVNYSVKQEIAKEGILIFHKFFGQSKNLSFGRFLVWIRSSKSSFINRRFYWLLKQPWLDPRKHSQETPFGALFLHWTFTIIMILATIHLTPTAAYGVLVELYSYTIVAIFGFAIAVGMLKLRFSSRERWRHKSSFSPAISIASATIFAIGSAYPILASWVPPHGSFAAQTKLSVPWFTTPTAAWSILGFGMVWYAGFNGYAARRAAKDGVEFQVQKVPEFDREPLKDGEGLGSPIQVHETVFMAWVAQEYNQPQVEMDQRSSRASF